MHPTPLPPRLPIYLAQCFPKTERPIPNGQGWPLREPAAFEVQEQLLPGLLTLPVAIPEAHQLFLAARISTHNDQNTMAHFLQSGLKVHAVDPEIHVSFARQVTLLPLVQFLLPPLLEPAQRGRR